jgi:type II secretory pathway component PulJ
VQYHKLVPMLLNEVQRQQRALEQQQREIDDLRTTIAALRWQF